MLHLLTSGACHFPVLITPHSIIQDRIVNKAYFTLPYSATDRTAHYCMGPKTYKPASLNSCGGEGPAGTHFQDSLIVKTWLEFQSLSITAVQRKQKCYS